MKPAEVSLANDTDVRVVRRFAAPAEKVWRAFTEPEWLTRWLVGYPGWTMPVCEMNLRVGGTYRWRWRNESEGVEFGFTGEFREIEPSVKLVHTQLFDPGTMGGDMGSECLITLTLSEAEGTTELVTVIRYASATDREAALSTGMTDGMEVNYGVLDSLFSV